MATGGAGLPDPVRGDVPLPAGSGSGGVDIRVNGENAPRRPAVRLINSCGAFLDHRGYAADIGPYTADDGRFDEPGERSPYPAWLSPPHGDLAARAASRPSFAYYEDIDWCWRARLAGMRLLYEPTATVEHRLSAKFRGEHQPHVRVMAERNRTLTMVRNGPGGLAVKALSGCL